jgi:hypothetical protein
MVNVSLSSFYRDDDLVIYVPSSATSIVDIQQLNLKFKLVILDDIENIKKRHELKE